MFKNMSISTKMFFLVTAVVAISFFFVTWIVSSRSTETAKQDAFSLAEEMADKYKNEILAELQGARVTSETLKTVFETLKEHNVTGRNMMNDMLITALAQKEYITAFCVAFDPNMLDGLDDQYVGLWPIYDETGRFAPYWNKLGGNIEAEPLQDIDSQDWYIVPKATLQEYITDPYPFKVQGRDVMLASFIFPVIHEGEFIGIIASDIVLDKLQEMVSHVNTRGMGEFTEIFSNTGAVVAHPNKLYLGETIVEKFLYDVIMSESGNIDGMLQYANEYIALYPVDDEEQLTEYNNMVEFAKSLRIYADDPTAEIPDISLLSSGLANAMLQADNDKYVYVQEIVDAIAKGELYIYESSDYYTVYMPINFSEATNPWSVTVSIPMDKALSSAHSLRNYIIIVYIIAILIIICVLFMIAKSVTKPILILVNSTRLFGEGNFDAEVPLIQGNNEIGVLSRAFKVMSERINELIKSLQAHTNELEKKNDYLNSLNEKLAATNQIAETILNVERQHFPDVLWQALRILGESAGAESVSIWENFMHTDGKPYSRRLSRWFAEKAFPDMNVNDVFDFAAALPEWTYVSVKNAGTNNLLDGSDLLNHYDEFQYGNSLFFLPLILRDSYWGVIEFSHKSKEYRPQNDECEILRSGGMMIAAAIIQNQISEELADAEEMASTDALTGITNRNGFLIKASAVFSKSKVQKVPLTIMFFDLDHFKRVNDKYGHPFGDEVLKAFANIVKQEENENGICCRYGGEEFILMLYDCGVSAGQDTAERILEAVRNIRFSEYPEFHITVSVGMISDTPVGHDSLNTYVKKADDALYQAKKNGRNQLVVYLERPPSTPNIN